MKLERMPLNKRLYEQLKQDIMERRIEFGEKLINRELQQKYGVSSTPVRDAINRLYMDGLVEHISNSGARVVTFDLEFVLEVNEMLSLLCCAAVEYAAERADHKKLCVQLEEALLLQEQLTDADEYFHYDYLFHKAFFDHCKNTQLQKTYSRYYVLFEMLVKRFRGLREDGHKFSVDQHRQIFNSYRSGDTRLAIDNIREHFINARQSFKQYMS